MVIQHIETDRDGQSETTRYWHTVDGVDYCIADCCGSRTLLDSDGCPIEPCNDHKATRTQPQQPYNLFRILSQGAYMTV